MQLLKKSAIFSIFISAIACSVLPERDWNSFKVKFNKSYKDEHDELMRREFFYSNMKLIEEHNIKHEQGLVTFKLGMNQFADYSPQEYAAGGHRLPAHSKAAEDPVDWRDRGVIGAVGDQGGCNSCWAFAITGALEAHWAMKNKANVTLSVQNLMDCTPINTTLTPCAADLFPESLDSGYQYILEHGIDTEEAYPYEYWTYDECKFQPDAVGATITGIGSIPEGDEEALRVAVASIGPISVSADTHDFSFLLYDSGVYYYENCASAAEDLNHAMVVVGYGTEDGQDYWIAKNSWGTYWGDDGFIKMARNRNNNCGIATIARYPIL